MSHQLQLILANGQGLYLAGSREIPGTKSATLWITVYNIYTTVFLTEQVLTTLNILSIHFFQSNSKTGWIQVRLPVNINNHFSH